MKKVFIYTNDIERSLEIKSLVLESIPKFGFRAVDELSEADFIFVIGGDGTLLGLMRNHQFPTIPIVGINTGHLGFFQEVNPEKLDHFLSQFGEGRYKIQPYNIAKAVIEFDDHFIEKRALNEFTIKSPSTHSIHFNISVNDSFIERFSGDGIIVATPAGSTAYNYSLGGALVDPRLHLLQVTPMAPMNTTAYRSLTSPILLPSNDNLIIEPFEEKDRRLLIVCDGEDEIYDNVRRLTLTLSRRRINLVRFDDYSFWDKVKEKFL